MKLSSLSRKRSRGFTLVEVMVASAIAGIVLSAATVATIAITRSITALQQQAEADNEAKLLVDYINTEALQTGGGSVRPWETISADCSSGSGMPACPGQTDRLHIVEADDSFPSCTVAAWDGASGTATVVAPGGVCCLDAWGGQPQDIVIVPTVTGGGWAMRKCTPSSSPCQCALTALTNETNLNPHSGVTVNAASWPNATISVARQVSFYMDPATHSLFERVDTNGDHVAETILMSDRVYDFQVQFGYDDNPVDGHLDSTWFADVNPAKATNLRMVRIGVIVGIDAPAKDSSSTAQLFGGTVISATKGKLYRATYGAVALRNVLVFY